MAVMWAVDDDTAPSNVEPATYWCESCQREATGICEHYQETKDAALEAA